MVTAVAPSSIRVALRTRVALLVALLVAEGGALAARFDAFPLLDRPHAWWAVPLAHAGLVMPAVMATATALVLLGGVRLWNELEAAVAAAPPHQAWPFLVAHLLTFVGFFCLTAIVFEQDGGGGGAAAWAATGLVSVAAWAASALPRQALRRFARRGAAVLVVGTAVGALAVAAGQVTVEWWYPLSRSTMWMVYRLIVPFTHDPIYLPEYFVIGTQTFQIEIAPKCSGYQGIGLVSVFLATYLVTFRRTLRYPHALLLLPLGALVMWFVNAIRIACLIGVGMLVSPEVAIGGFHANSGSLLVCVVALGLGWLGHRLPFFSTVPVRPAERFADSPTAAHLAPLVVIVATSMATGAATSGGFDAFYGVRVLAAATTLWMFRHGYADWRWRWSWPAVGIGIVVFGLWLGLERPPADGAGAALANGLAALPPAGRVGWLALRVLGAVVTVPIAEELAFRGYLARRLVARDFTAVSPSQLGWLAIVGSSVLFGVMHDRFVAGTVAGLLYAVLLVRRGSLGDAILAHATTNALLAAWVLATGSWFLW